MQAIVTEESSGRHMATEEHWQELMQLMAQQPVVLVRLLTSQLASLEVVYQEMAGRQEVEQQEHIGALAIRHMAHHHLLQVIEELQEALTNATWDFQQAVELAGAYHDATVVTYATEQHSWQLSVMELRERVRVMQQEGVAFGEVVAGGMASWASSATQHWAEEGSAMHMALQLQTEECDTLHTAIAEQQRTIARQEQDITELSSQLDAAHRLGAVLVAEQEARQVLGAAEVEGWLSMQGQWWALQWQHSQREAVVGSEAAERQGLLWEAWDAQSVLFDEAWAQQQHQQQQGTEWQAAVEEERVLRAVAEERCTVQALETRQLQEELRGMEKRLAVAYGEQRRLEESLALAAAEIAVMGLQQEEVSGRLAVAEAERQSVTSQMEALGHLVSLVAAGESQAVAEVEQQRQQHQAAMVELRQQGERLQAAVLSVMARDQECLDSEYLRSCSEVSCHA